MGATRMGSTAAGMVILGAWSLPAGAQLITDTEPEAPSIGREVEQAGEEGEELFILNRVPPLQKLDSLMNRIDEALPLSFGAEAAFLSDWMDEGFNWAKKGLQIQQTYWVEMTHEFDDASAGIGFEYYQIDTTGAVEGASTVERDFCVYAPLEWWLFSVSPYWCYIRYDDWDDTGEIGAEFSLNTLLNPTFRWNYDYDDVKGYYFEWSISHDIAVVREGESLCTFTPSMALGLNSRKYIDRTTLSHIDWGLDLSIPLTERFVMTGLLHFTKSLTHMEDEDGVRVFQDILPWAGLSLAMEF